jgi:hypothetical protein
MSRRYAPLGITVAALLAWSSIADAKPKTAVLGIETRGAQNQKLVLVGKLMTQKLRTEVAKPKSPFDLSQVNEDFLTIKIMHDCPGAAYPCMSRITKDVLKAKYSIYGTVEKDPRGYVFQLTLLNAETAQPEGQLTEVVPLTEADDDAKAGDWARAFYNQLLGRRQEGKLVVRSNVAAGTVFVDGKNVGNLADGVVVVPNVQPGEREVSVDSDGQTAKATVDVVAGETSEIELTVVKNGGGPGPVNGGGGSNVGWQIAFYTGAVGTVGLAAMGIYEFTRIGDGKHYADEVERANDAVAPDPGPIVAENVCDENLSDPAYTDVRDACDAGDAGALRANIGGIGAAVLGVATLFFAYKAFISDNGSSVERDRLSSRRKRKEPKVRIIPGGPGDIGAGLEVTF